MKFKKGDKVIVDKPDILAQEYPEHYVQVLTNIPGEITEVTQNTPHDTWYYVLFPDLSTIRKWNMPEKALSSYIELTPETDAVFRDIVKGI